VGAVWGQWRGQTALLVFEGCVGEGLGGKRAGSGCPWGPCGKASLVKAWLPSFMRAREHEVTEVSACVWHAVVGRGALVVGCWWSGNPMEWGFDP
jgi:hypothetical protein